MTDWLGIIDALITLLATIVVAIATVVLARITSRYAKTTDEMLKAGDKPEILIYLFPSESSIYFHNEIFTNCINLCIQNVGTGYASDLKFGGQGLSFIQPTTRMQTVIRKAGRTPERPKGTPLGEISIFKNGINYFPPGRKIEINLFYTTNMEELLGESLNLTATYKDSRGIEVPEKSYSMRFDQWERFSNYVSPNATAALSLQTIANEISEVLRMNRS